MHYCILSIEQTAAQTIILITEIKNLMQDYKHRIKRDLPKIYSLELLNNLFKNPYTKIEFLQADLGVSRQTAAIYLDSLAELTYIEKVKLGKQNYYFNVELVAILANAQVKKT